MCRYKAAGANATDETGAPDTIEFINVSKDDALSYPAAKHRTYPSATAARMESTITPFVRQSIAVNDVLLAVLNDRLGLPPGALADKHRMDEPSASETRVIKNPRNQNMPPDKVAIGAHTDFGSLVGIFACFMCLGLTLCVKSFLHHQKLGGLQVLPPGTEEWKYVKVRVLFVWLVHTRTHPPRCQPLPGHAICNVGDALAIFSGGILRSNLHRVVPPPGAQAAFERWSVVYFTRPGASQALEPLADRSALIADAAARAEPGRFATGATAGEWFARRIKNQRIANRKVCGSLL
jgi:isopenicillin N synthase-like dioxygenase